MGHLVKHAEKHWERKKKQDGGVLCPWFSVLWMFFSYVLVTASTELYLTRYCNIGEYSCFCWPLQERIWENRWLSLPHLCRLTFSHIRDYRSSFSSGIVFLFFCDSALWTVFLYTHWNAKFVMLVTKRIIGVINIVVCVIISGTCQCNQLR